MGEKCSDIFRLRIRLPRNSRDLLHAANLRHGTDGFTSPPKEGALRIFSPLKIRRLRRGLDPRTWVPKASTLPVDHRSHNRNKFLCVRITLPQGTGLGRCWFRTEIRRRQSPVSAHPFISLPFICTTSSRATIVSPLKWNTMRFFNP